MTTKEIQFELMPVVDGLLMKSDIDAPFEWFHRELEPGQEFSTDTLTEWVGKASGMDVETREMDDFFQEMGGVGADARNKGETNEKRYQLLKSKLNELLEDVKVYLITEIGTEAFILGKTENGDYAGLRTMVVHDESSVD